LTCTPALPFVERETGDVKDVWSLRQCAFGGRWSIVAPQRSNRPLPRDGQPPNPVAECPFCEGNEGDTEPEVYALRAVGSAPDSPGWMVRVVPNKFPALAAGVAEPQASLELSRQVAARGAHEVIVDSPRHHLALGHFGLAELEQVLQTYRKRLGTLCMRPDVKSVALFRNEGGAAGASQAHPHAQIIALPIVSNRLERAVAAAVGHLRSHGTCATCEMAGQQSALERLVARTQDIVAVTSFAPRLPYETWILPCRHSHDFVESTDSELHALAQMLKRVLLALEATLGPFPFNLILQTAPVGADDAVRRAFHWRMEVVPRLTTPSGFELGTDVSIVTVSPEKAASALRAAVACPAG
jgi:UDPglucose--hexose-1-phosphate uridylyltransferase